MTIQVTFENGGERKIVRVIGNNVLFFDLSMNTMSTIEGLQFNKKGVEKEHPDLIGDKDWKQKAIQRFVDKIKSFKTEIETTKWLIEEIKKMGGVPLYQQRNGFRPEKIR